MVCVIFRRVCFFFFMSQSFPLFYQRKNFSAFAPWPAPAFEVRGSNIHLLYMLAFSPRFFISQVEQNEEPHFPMLFPLISSCAVWAVRFLPAFFSSFSLLTHTEPDVSEHIHVCHCFSVFAPMHGVRGSLQLATANIDINDRYVASCKLKNLLSFSYPSWMRLRSVKKNQQSFGQYKNYCHTV